MLPELSEGAPAASRAGHHAQLPSLRRLPYIVVIRESGAGGAPDIEHRFVGLFTIAAMSANVLEIPLIARRVADVFATAQGDPSHPGQLMLDIIQTIPRSELFSLNSQQLFRMAESVVDLGSRRRAAVRAR